LRQRENYRNGKLRLRCVKTVEGRNFLWKGKEKCIFIRGATRRMSSAAEQAAEKVDVRFPAPEGLLISKKLRRR